MNYQEMFVAFYTIVRKETIRFTRIWIQTLVPPVITCVLYFIIFGNLIGSQLAKLHGFTYMEYIIPGLVMMSVITNSYMNSCFSFFSNKFQKSIEELLVSPTPNAIILMGYATGGALRGLVVGFIVMMVSLFFTAVPVHSFFFVILFAVLTSCLFSLAGLVNGIFAKKFDDLNIVPTFILTPLTYLGGVFYSSKQLTGVWYLLSQLNPIFYIINGFRYGFLGITDAPLGISLFVLVMGLVGSFVLALKLLNSGYGLKS